MESKEEIFLELISSRALNEFIHDFIEYWEKVIEEIKPDGRLRVSWKNWNEIADNIFDLLTRPFYDKWKRFGIVSWIEAYIKEFSSITINFKDFKMLLPHQLIFYETCKPSNSLLSSLRKSPTKNDFERVVVSLWKNLNIKLRKSDFLIIQKLSQPKFSKSLDRYPKLKELAYGIRRDVRTVSNSLNYLFNHHILSLMYLVDMARIGYETLLIFHKKKISDIPQAILPYVVMSFPSSPHGGQTTIIQYPYRDSESYAKLINFFGSEERILMKNQYQGWNFGGLTQDPKNRWSLHPPLLEEGGKWDIRILIGETGVEFNLDPQYDQFPLSYRQGRLLGLVHKLSSMAEETIAKQLKISRAYLLADWNELLKNNIIFRFPIFNNLGLDSWNYFYIRGLTNERREVLTNIIEHLKFFPYVKLFSNLEAGVLVGYVRIAPSWTNIFMTCLATLPVLYPETISYNYIGPEKYLPWGFDILGTFDWQNYR